MLKEYEKQERQNAYVMDPESGAEMARLMDLDRIITQNMGGLFPQELCFSPTSKVLDIACGPGGWLLEVAFAYEEIEGVGVDISQTMIDYARTQAQVRLLDNVRFQVMDVTKPLNFPDNYFDIVNARFIVGFMPRAQWPQLLKECLRILKKEGHLIVTESEWSITNGPATEKLAALCIEAIYLAGMSFAADGRHLGITNLLWKLLRDAGCQYVNQQAHILNFSAGSKAYHSSAKNMENTYALILPFLLKMGVTTQEEFDILYEQCRLELMSEDFCGSAFQVRAWGQKP